MVAAACPSCGNEIKLQSNLKMGQQVRCRSCNADLEVVWLEPVELDWPYDESDLDDVFADYEGDD